MDSTGPQTMVAQKSPKMPGYAEGVPEQVVATDLLGGGTVGRNLSGGLT